MVREAATRLYDVDQSSVVLKKMHQSEKYDIGTITFRAKQGKRIDLDKLHESIWATRLSGGTSSGLVSLEVTAVGDVVGDEKETTLKVTGSDAYFALGKHPDDKHQAAFDELRSALGRGEKVVSVSGRIDGWTGRWPSVLHQLPPKPRRILVTEFETAKDK